MRRTKALLSCLLALALVMLTACGARQQTVHRPVSYTHLRAHET